MIIMSIKRYLLSVVAFIAALNFSAFAITAEEVLTRSASLVAKGVSGKFSATMNGRSINGTINAVGTKFAIVTSGVSTWYNGKSMWTYNPATKETTLVTPTPSELAESNPFNYLKSWKSGYSSSLANKMQGGNYLITLTPKSKYSSVKSVMVYINGKNWKPSSFKISLKDGSVSTITPQNLTFGSEISNSVFVYPVNKYKGVEIVDLR